MTLTPLQRVVFDTIAAAATRGDACPSNDALAEAVGAASGSVALAAIQRLEAGGLIRVERFSKGREVTIVATGQATVWTGKRQPHWRERLQVPA